MVLVDACMWMSCGAEFREEIFNLLHGQVAHAEIESDGHANCFYHMLCSLWNLEKISLGVERYGIFVSDLAGFLDRAGRDVGPFVHAVVMGNALAVFPKEEADLPIGG